MNIDIKSAHGLIPAIIQDSETKNVLMLGYMNEESLQKTIDTGKVTFYSRSKQRLWTKGEESGNFLNLVDMKNDCDGDTIIFDKYYEDGPTFLTVDNGQKLDILKQVTPKAGKVILFDGKYFHTNIFPSVGKFRFVCVFTLQK